MAAQNGVNSQNNAANGRSEGPVWPSPGYTSDMNVLMDNMERLSSTLQRNRQEWLQLQEGLAGVERLQVCRCVKGQLISTVQLEHQSLVTNLLKQSRSVAGGQRPMVNGNSQGT